MSSTSAGSDDPDKLMPNPEDCVHRFMQAGTFHNNTENAWICEYCNISLPLSTKLPECAAQCHGFARWRDEQGANATAVFCRKCLTVRMLSLPHVDARPPAPAPLPKPPPDPLPATTSTLPAPTHKPISVIAQIAEKPFGVDSSDTIENMLEPRYGFCVLQ